MQISAKVRYYGRQTTALKRLLFSRSTVLEFSEAFVEINAAYKAFTLKRFLKFSAGGGNWKKLAASTVARKGHDAILRDTDQMLSEISPRIVKTEGILSAKSRAGFSIVSGTTKRDKIFEIHDKGKGRMPRRQILVGPDSACAEAIARIVERHMQAYLRRAKKE